MKKNPLLVLQSFGQSVWLDYLGRGAINSGQLQRLIEEDGVGGVTSKPSIFEKAIMESHDYDAAIQALAQEERSVGEIYQTLTVEDIQMAADLFRSTYGPRLPPQGWNDAARAAKAARIWTQVCR